MAAGLRWGEMQIKKYHKKVRLAQRIWERVYQHRVFILYIIELRVNEQSLKESMTRYVETDYILSSQYQLL